MLTCGPISNSASFDTNIDLVKANAVDEHSIACMTNACHAFSLTSALTCLVGLIFRCAKSVDSLL